MAICQQIDDGLSGSSNNDYPAMAVTAFGIDIESLDRAQMCRSSVVNTVPELELSDERNDYGQRRSIE